ncbi:hypothetical protein EYR38_002357 [Pleurotus pulmonarius]|nr:hypothetical protein EYR38_002357 [Pleurotus pulmonarius]
MLDYRARQATQARKATLRGFAIAVESKKDWFFKIEALANKWVQEADLLAEDGTIGDDVVEMIWDLKAAAHRIRAIDHKVWLHSPSLPERGIDFKKIRTDVLISLKHSKSSKFAVRLADLRDRIGVYISDGIVPPSLHQELVAELDSLAALEPKDFHPGTFGKVQDLIHPSLYPYIANRTPIHPSAKVPVLYEDQFVTSIITQNDFAVDHSSTYAWIPSIFTISDDGKAVQIDSYINGLGPREQYPSLYALIENVFLCLLPHFERTVKPLFESRDTGAIERWKEREPLRPRAEQSEWEKLERKQKKDKEEAIKRKEGEQAKFASEMLHDWQCRPSTVDPKDPALATSFKGRSLKVIVKAANYILKPGQEYDGSWHLEGMPHERIVSSAIYYYDTNDLVHDSGLGFRRIRREEEDFPPSTYTWDEHFSISLTKPKKSKSSQDYNSDGDGDDNDDNGSENSWGTYDYPSDWNEERQHVLEGVVPTTHTTESQQEVGHGTGRVISFPNWLQHKVMGLQHIDDNKSNDTPLAIRKILCFFLVDDNDEGDNVDGEGHLTEEQATQYRKVVGEEENSPSYILQDGTETPKDKQDNERVDGTDRGEGIVKEKEDDNEDPKVVAEDNTSIWSDDDDDDDYGRDRDDEAGSAIELGPGLTCTGLKGMHVLSTADVPDQRRRTNIPTLRVLLPIVCKLLTGKHLPPELVEFIVSADLGGTTREMAEKHRLEFMEDRRVKASNEDEIFEADYTLCEH